MHNETYICFDYGEKRIGIAVGQMLTQTATALEIIQVRNNKPDWQRIAEIIDEWQPHAFVVGIPLQMDGTRQKLTDSAEKFSHQLEGRYKLPVHYADERLSSYEARRRLKDTRNLDAVAAQVILESWLAEQAKLMPADATIEDHLQASEKE